jgi:hypothetical protein
VSVAAVGVCPWSINAVETVGALAVASVVYTVTVREGSDVWVSGPDALSVTFSSNA